MVTLNLFLGVAQPRFLLAGIHREVQFLLSVHPVRLAHMGLPMGNTAGFPSLCPRAFFPGTCHMAHAESLHARVWFLSDCLAILVM